MVVNVNFVTPTPAKKGHQQGDVLSTYVQLPARSCGDNMLTVQQQGDLAFDLIRFPCLRFLILIFPSCKIFGLQNSMLICHTFATDISAGQSVRRSVSSPA